LNADAETSAFFFASIYNESLFLQWLSLNCDPLQKILEIVALNPARGKWSSTV